MYIFTKFQKDWTTIVAFLLIAKFWDCLLFFLDHPLCVCGSGMFLESRCIQLFFKMNSSGSATNDFDPTIYLLEIHPQDQDCMFLQLSRGKLLLELWVTTSLPD